MYAPNVYRSIHFPELPFLKSDIASEINSKPLMLGAPVGPVPRGSSRTSVLAACLGLNCVFASIRDLEVHRDPVWRNLLEAQNVFLYGQPRSYR
jgi:hypothetical protein